MHVAQGVLPVSPKRLRRLDRLKDHVFLLLRGGFFFLLNNFFQCNHYRREIINNRIPNSVKINVKIEVNKTISHSNDI
jgi:hypothetical protein